MNDSVISENTTNEVDSMSDDGKKFLYARAVHSNHSIQYNMHQTMESQRVVDEYRNMMREGMDLIPLESNLHKFNPVIMSQIINMIESDNFWHHKTFESVMSDLQNIWAEGIQELKNAHMHCTNNDKNKNEMDGVEVINLCSVSQSKNDTFSEGKESTKQESRDKSKHDGLKTMRSKSTTKKGKVESAMMCWEPTSNFSKEETHEEPEKVVKKPAEKTEKQKHEEEHVGPKLDAGSRLKISIEEFGRGGKDDGSTLETVEPEQQQIVYIMNLEDGLPKNSTKLYDEEGPNEKKPDVRNRLIEEPSLNNLNHVFEVYEESGSDVDYIDDSLKGENKKNSKEDNYTNMGEEKERKQAGLLRLKISRSDHDIPRKKGENEKALVPKEMELSHLGKNHFIGH